MFKWWKNRRDIKKLKALKKELNEAVSSLGIVRDQTTIGELTNSQSAVGTSLEDVNITQIIMSLYAIIEEMNNEIDDRTREREPIFKKAEVIDAL